MVKITFKTLQQKTFTVDAEPSETVLDLKKKIETSQGFAVDTQKIIFAGKILADDKTVGDANFKEKDFCVVMVSKPKAAPAAPAAPVASTSAPVPSTPAQPVPSTPVAPPAPGPAVTAPAETPAVPAEGAPAAAEGQNDDPSSFLVGSALETSVNEMVAMGFPLDQVKKALRASFNNPHRAVEYLFNGIPADANPAPPPPPAGSTPVPQTPGTPSPTGAAPAAHPAPIPGSRNLFEAAAAAAANPSAATGAGAAGAGAAAAAGAGAAAGGNNVDIEALRRNPQFAQIRQLVQQNPALLQVFLQQLAQTNPELLALIDANQAEFVRFLQEGTEGEDDDMAGILDQFGEGGAGGEGGEQFIEVNEEEKAAIERLVGMGFDRNVVIQAYFACGKDEELTANYLVEHGWDDDDGGFEQ